MGAWHLYDTQTRKAYLDIVYLSREHADLARDELLPLQHYPLGHPWRARLVVALGAPVMRPRQGRPRTRAA